LDPQIIIALDEGYRLIAELHWSEKLCVRQLWGMPSSIFLFRDEFHDAALVNANFYLILDAPRRNVVAECPEFLEGLAQTHKVIGKKKAAVS
jgi:hypothetical protein